MKKNKTKIQDKLKDLINVKSLVTLVLTGVFAYLAIIGKITPEQLILIYTTIIAFYFGTQKQKKDDSEPERTSSSAKEEDGDAL